MLIPLWPLNTLTIVKFDYYIPLIWQMNTYPYGKTFVDLCPPCFTASRIYMWSGRSYDIIFMIMYYSYDAQLPVNFMLSWTHPNVTWHPSVSNLHVQPTSIKNYRELSNSQVLFRMIAFPPLQVLGYSLRSSISVIELITISHSQSVKAMQM